MDRRVRGGRWLITTGSTPRRPVLRGQMGNSSKFTRVVRYQSQAEAASMRCNEQIVGADYRALLLQVGANFCVIESCLIGEIQHPNIRKKSAECSFILRPSRRHLNSE